MTATGALGDFVIKRDKKDPSTSKKASDDVESEQFRPSFEVFSQWLCYHQWWSAGKEAGGGGKVGCGAECLKKDVLSVTNSR
jgi:hypothetical protein